MRLGPYVLLGPIGAGGMGEVWKASDSRLDRVVAIKRLKERHSERFQQEARTIAALNHPHICQVYDIGPDYLVLEYVEGQRLPAPLAPERATRLAIEIASAIEAAHRKGIIHRDLKPANIMVTGDGSAKLLDFGLAKLVVKADVDDTCTMEGAVLGTMAYMSPEQAEERHSTSARTCSVLARYCMKCSPVSARSAANSVAQVLCAILQGDPPRLDAPAPLERIVRRCLAKPPVQRFQNMAEVRTALEQIFATPTEPQPSIAVLPFANMSADKENEYFSDGLAEEIINPLAKIPT